MTQCRSEQLIFGYEDAVWDQIARSTTLDDHSNPMGKNCMDQTSSIQSCETDISCSVPSNIDVIEKGHGEDGTPLTPLDSSEENEGNSEDTFSTQSTCPPPRPEDIDRWQHHIAFQQFGEDLQAAAAAVFPNTRTSRYRKVYVLMLKWEDEDPKLPVSEEIKRLDRVFKDVYHFETEIWSIPDFDCHAAVNQKILDFKRIGCNCKNDLKIVYYAGHGKLTKNRLLSWIR
jgi:hypothetical protein